MRPILRDGHRNPHADHTGTPHGFQPDTFSEAPSTVLSFGQCDDVRGTRYSRVLFTDGGKIGEATRPVGIGGDVSTVLWNYIVCFDRCGCGKLFVIFYIQAATALGHKGAAVNATVVYTIPARGMKYLIFSFLL